MMTKRILAILSVMAIILFCSCENETITGLSTGSLSIKVVGKSSNPIPGAEVKVFNEKEFTGITNSSGQCSFSSLATVNTIVRVKKDSYKRVYESFALSKGSNSKTLVLEPIEEFTEGFESGHFSGDWKLSGSANWFITHSESHSGNRSARSGAIGNYESSTISITVEVPTDQMSLSFWYKVSSGYDARLRFFINGIEQSYYWYGEIPWTNYVTTLSEGVYELKWNYYKDYSYPSGQDCAWIDDLSLKELGIHPKGFEISHW